MSDWISREAAVAICDEAACETDSESARYEMFRARAAIRALPAVQPDAAAILQERPDSLDRVARAICLASYGDANPVPVPDELMPNAWERLRDRYALLAEAAILALIDKPGKEVMPDAAQSPPARHDTGPGDQAVAGAAKYRKKPVVVEAMRFTFPPVPGLVAWCPALCDIRIRNAGSPFAEAEADIVTLEDGSDGRAKHVATEGDWIIRGVKGEFYPCKPDIFAATYELVAEPVAGAAPVTLLDVTCDCGKSRPCYPADECRWPVKAHNSVAGRALDCECGMGFGPCMDPGCKAPIIAQKGDSHEC
jgi:hypothetical protein